MTFSPQQACKYSLIGKKGLVDVVTLRILGCGGHPELSLGPKRNHMGPCKGDAKDFTQTHTGKAHVEMKQREMWPQTKKC